MRDFPETVILNYVWSKFMEKIVAHALFLFVKNKTATTRPNEWEYRILTRTYLDIFAGTIHL